uniref:Uncharacterized protein n=1 Tax=Ananas comosus var. bracteatus TaxID=296719 RepID=A0A6V7NSX5_ANACO|nr:unnamed protein product [Ananas comosus var. bracteatus]
MMQESGLICRADQEQFWGAGYRYQREVPEPRRATERYALGFELYKAEYRYCIARVPVLEPGTGTASRGYRYLAICLLDRGSGLRDLWPGIGTPTRVPVCSAGTAVCAVCNFCIFEGS